MVESLLKNPKIELNGKNNKANTSDKKEIIQKIDNLPLLDDDVSDENKYSINNNMIMMIILLVKMKITMNLLNLLL